MEQPEATTDRDVEPNDIVNLRGLGGYPTTDGRTARRVLIFRGAGLQRSAGAHLEIVRALGCKTLTDLRTDLEVEGSGTAPAEAPDATAHHLLMIPEVWDRPPSIPPSRPRASWPTASVTRSPTVRRQGNWPASAAPPMGICARSVSSPESSRTCGRCSPLPPDPIVEAPNAAAAAGKATHRADLP